MCRIDSDHNLKVIRKIHKEIPEHSMDKVRGIFYKLKLHVQYILMQSFFIIQMCWYSTERLKREVSESEKEKRGIRSRQQRVCDSYLNL